jgi:secondary thiamine-phosphate synthase enzyme
MESKHGSFKTIHLRTENRIDFYDITSEIESQVSDSGVRDGTLLVFTPHTTAGITINENADPSVRSDIREFISRNIPNQSYFKHFEGNSPSHIMSSLFSASETIIIQDGQLVLGTWQGIFFCEFDGPRNRKVYVKIIGD